MTTKKDKIILRTEQEYITEDIRQITRLMWDEKQHKTKPSMDFQEPVTIRNVVNDSGCDLSRNFIVSSLLSNSREADIPMVYGHWEGEDNNECVHLLCNATKAHAERFDSHWDVENLLNAITKNGNK